MMRTGVSVRQPGRFRAFVPAPLPPELPLKLDAELLELLSEASQALGRLDGIAAFLPDANQFLRDFASEEGDASDVSGTIDALALGVERLARQPFSRSLLLELHGRLLAGVARNRDRAPGSFRDTQNWIGVARRGEPNEVHFFPPPVTEMHAALDDLLVFMNQKAPFAPLIQAGLILSQFETIHPFRDGNGRMGRLLVTLVLYHRGILRPPLLDLGRHLKQPSWEPLRKLQSTYSRSNLEGWLAFFLRAVRDVGRDQVEAADKVLRAGHLDRRVQPSADKSLDSKCGHLHDDYQSQHPLAGAGDPRSSTFLEDRLMNGEESFTPTAEQGPAVVGGNVGIASAKRWGGSSPGPGVMPSACDCAACSGSQARGENLIFALGTVSYDLVTEARAESIQAHMGGDPTNHALFLDYLQQNPWEAASVTWTLQIDEAPIYAILPRGPFAAEGYQRLRTFLAEHNANETERVSIPGKVSGRTTLLNGQILDVVVPELRGMASWTTTALVDAVAGQPQSAKPAAQATHTAKIEGVGNFLQRVYHEFRNLGVTAEERAINFAATNASKVAGVFHLAATEGMELDIVSVERSPICRVGSECWDVKMMFFYPDRPVQSVRKAYRFTVDVSDVVPVLVGPIRSWSVR